MGSEFAPIALFAWKRPDHLRRVLESLVANPEAASTDLVAFCDGPRDESQRLATDSVTELLDGFEGFEGFRSLRVVRRDTNWGLAKNIISGVTEMIQTHGRVIVVEDDLMVAPGFLAWMNAGLEHYADETRVASIHGYVYPTASPLPGSFFLRGADCWGWATWERSWKDFNPDGASLAMQLRRNRLDKSFDWNGAFGYLEMLDDQVKGRNDSWAIRWHASCFLAERFTLYPGRSLVQNIGHDDSGTHSGATRLYDVTLANAAKGPWPERIEENPLATDPIREFLWKSSQRRRPLWDRLSSWIGRHL